MSRKSPAKKIVEEVVVVEPVVKKSPKKRATRKTKVVKSPALESGKKRKAGTVARTQIKAYQSAKHAETRHVARAAVERLIREKIDNEARVADATKTIFHDVIETFIIDVFAHANGEAVAAGRKTLYATDINRVAQIGKSKICKWF